MSFSAELDDERKAEAARYFGEFTALKNSKYNQTPECTAKLEAALALDPDNPKYRYEEIRYRTEMIRNLPYPQRIAEWPAQWERCRKFREQFPSWRPAGVMDTYCVLPGLDRRITRPGTDSYSLAENILEKMRLGAEQEERNFNRSFASPESISNLRELQTLGRIYSRKCRPEYFVSLPRCLEAQLRSEYEFFRYVEKYFSEHPEQQKKIADILNRDGNRMTIDMMKCWGLEFPDRRKAVTDHLNSSAMAEYINFLSRCRLPYLKRIRIILENMRKMVNAPQDKEHYRVGLQMLFAELEREFPQDMVPSVNPVYWEDWSFDWDLRNFFRMMLDDFNFYHAEKRCFQQKYEHSDWAKLEETIDHGSLEELSEQLESMHKYNYDRITNNRAGNLYGRMTDRLFEQDGKFRNAVAEKIFYDANSHFRIQTELYEKLRGGIFSPQSLQVLSGAARSGKKTWLLLRRSRKTSEIPEPTPELMLACLGDDGTISTMIDTPLPADSFEGKDDFIARRPAPIACDSQYIAIADRERNIHVYDQEDKCWTLIPEASPAPVMALVIASGRIWGIGGSHLGKAEKDFCMMFSCAMDGSNRRIHFSTARSRPQNELDGMKIREIDSMIVSGKSLLFTVTTDHKMSIFSFSMETEIFTRIIEFPFTGAGIDHLWSQHENVYCFTMGHGERIYRIDPERKTAEWIFNQTGARYKFDPSGASPVVLKNGHWQMNHPWAFHGKMLYSANCTPGAIRLDNVEKSPLLLLPSCAYVFETADGVLFLGRHRYFFVREKISKNENGKESVHAPKQ